MLVCRSSLTRWFAFCAVLCLLSLPAALAVIPNSDNPVAYTEKDYRKALFEFNQQTMSGAYLKVGKRNPKWDDLAVKLQDAQAAEFTNFGAYTTDCVPVPADWQQRKLWADQLQDLGCDDPLVLYVCMRQMQTSEDGYVDVVRRAYETLKASDYPLVRKHGAASWLLKQLQRYQLNDEAEQVAAYIGDLLVEQIIAKPLSIDQQRFILSTMMPSDDLPLATWRSVVERINASDSPNRWLIDVFDGSYHIEAAWDARGSGWADTVTEEGWESFKEHLHNAHESLARAWQAHPELPHAASKLIRVSLGLGDGDQKLWFDRATTAQFDYFPAYYSYGNTLRPRWYGSQDQLYAFAVECLDTHRFDTQVPSYFYEALWLIYQDTWDYRYWRQPGVYENFVKYFEGRKHEPNPSDPPSWWDSMEAVIAWRVGHYQEAAKQIETMGDAFNPKPFTYFDSTPEIGLSELAARIGPYGDFVRGAEREWNRYDFKEAAYLVDTALKDVPDDDPARPYLEMQSARAAWQHSLSTGDWVNLLDRSNLGGWQQDRGEWSVDPHGRIIGRSTGDGLFLKCRYDFGYHMELHGTLTLPQDNQPSWYNGGVMLSYYWWNARVYPRAILLFRDLNKLAHERYFYYDKAFYPVELDKTNTFLIQMWDQHIRVYVNDQLIIGHLILQPKLSSRPYPFAIGSGMLADGVEVRFDTLAVRQLYEEPEWINDPPTPFLMHGDDQP